MSIVTQGAAGTLTDASSMGKVIAATSLPPTQLVVTQQKSGSVVGLPSLPPGSCLVLNSVLVTDPLYTSFKAHCIEISFLTYLLTYCPK